MPKQGWAVELNGVVISGSGEPGDGCLVRPPEGLGNPAIRNEDVTFPQRDGVRHFADWYEPRIITLEASVCAGDGCGKSCPGAREHVRNILQAWGRKCDDVELIVWTDCSDSLPCPDESPGESPGGGPLEVWPLDGDPETLVTGPNSGLDLINRDGGTIDYSADGTSVEFTSTGGGSYTIARGLIDADTQASYFGIFSITEAPTADLVIGTIRQATSDVPAVRIVVTPSRDLQLRDFANTDIDGPLGKLTVGSTYQLTVVADTVTGGIHARLYTAAGNQVGEFIGTAALGGQPINGFEIGINSQNPDSTVFWHEVRMEAGRTSEIPPEGRQFLQDRSLVGPYGIVGRPRVATVEWLRGKSGCARLTLRFDARDHRMFILGCEGETDPVCVTAEPSIETMGRTYPRCYNGDGMCFDCDTGRESGDAVAEVIGTECASPIICFNGQLSNPVLTNVTTGDQVGIRGTIRETDPPICINTETGTAEQNGATRTSVIVGDAGMRLQPGVNILRLTSTQATDTGFAEICYRPFAVSA